MSDIDYEEFKAYVFKDRDVAQCIEPSFARVLGHDRFLPVHLSPKTRATEILDPINSNAPFSLGNKFLQDIIPPCSKRCQHHAVGHLYVIAARCQ